LGFKSVVTVRDTDVTYKAFKLMIEKKVTGVAVVDANGKLIGNISVSDFKFAEFEHRFWDLLGSPVLKYLEQVTDKPESNIRSHLFSWLKESGKPPIVVSVKENDTLGTVIKFLTFYNIHRLFITDNNGKPIGVVSLYDVLKAVTEPV